MKKVAFLCGGISGEHEISLISCKHILKALDRKLFEPLLILIQKNREMHLISEEQLFGIPDNPKKIVGLHGEPVEFRPYSFQKKKPGFVCRGELLEVDVAFPVLHGEGGEDGSIQGFFETSGLPVVGCSITSSALTMDKALTKKICQMDQLPVAPFFELRADDRRDVLDVSYPCFVKPAVGGSSLGVSRVKMNDDLPAALDEAFRWHSKVMIEPAVQGRELEIAVFRDQHDFIASPAGEILCAPGEFYSYDAKYVDASAARLIAPAVLPPEDLQRLQKLALQVFESLDCWGMARVDFFMNEKSEFLLNEVNSIPGFTPISMYPKLMDLAGIPYPDLIRRLILSSAP